jgi:hypothetical protein
MALRSFMRSMDYPKHGQTDHLLSVIHWASNGKQGSVEYCFLGSENVIIKDFTMP